MKLFLFLLAVLLSTATATAQTKRITGKITNSEYHPLAGVIIKVKGSSVATTSDSTGRFTIDIPAGRNSIEFILLGHVSQEVMVGNKTFLEIQMKESTGALDDVVIVGYGKQKKSDITGSVTSISKERIQNMTRTDIVQLLQGAVPGLNVSSIAAGSNPENGSVLLIRGRNSISASNDPLIILDGVPYNGSLSDINPNDIESIEILKDASAAAIYGSRASNGVILIQTTKADKGKMRVRYDAFFSLQSIANFPHLMNGDEYYEYKKGVTGTGTDDDPAITQSELDVYNSGSYRDFTWKDLVMRQGYSHQHSLSLAGGNDKTTFNVSLSYLGTRGVVINDQYKRGTSRINVTSNVTRWLTLGSNTMLAYANNSGATPSFVDLFNKSPLAVPFNADGSVNIRPIADDPRKLNPIETTLYDDLKRKYSVSTNNYLNIDIPALKGLSYRLNTGLQFESSEKNWYRGTNTGKSGALRGEAETNSGVKYSYTIENIFSYQRQIKKHSVFLTGLYSIEERENKNNYLNAEGFPNDFLSWYGISQANKVVPTFFYFKTDLISQMFRANYGYDNRYLLTFTVRRDGYSGFGANKKFGVFPSVAVGWNIANESFFSKFRHAVNLLKLRVSYGENGNQAISPYQTLSQLGQGNYINGSTPAPGFIPTSLGTTGLGWESTKSANIGLDFGLFKSAVSGEINVYRNNTEDLLLKRAISAINGVNSVFQNIGKTRNEGVEFLVNTKNISRKNFSWTSNFNFAIIKTQIIDLYGDGKDDLANKWFLGKNIYVNYDYKFVGVWQTPDSTLAKQYGAQPGYARYDDLNGNGVYDPGDRQLIGSPEPTFTWGMTNNFTYKNFSFSVFMYGKKGARKANPYKDKSYLIEHNFWTPTNPTNEFWSRASQANKYLGTGNTPSVYESADFVRIKDITVTYSLSKKVADVIRLKSVRIYYTGKNLFTITKWGALDPELDNQRAIPLQREHIIGFNIVF